MALAQPSPEQAELIRLESLRSSLAPAEPTAAETSAPKQAADTAAILQTFDQTHGISKNPAATPAPPPLLQASAGGFDSDPYARASVPTAADLARSSNGLWPQLRRCWRPQKGFPPVKLSVALDDRGGLRETPGVVRDPTIQADPERSRAEAEAVRAVIACAPYAVVNGGPRSFELTFTSST